MITKTEIQQKGIMALSVKQPFADLILRGKQETRTRPTNYRGLVLIAASKKMYNQAEVFNICGIEQENRICRVYDQLESETAGKPYQLKGVAIGVARLINCRRMEEKDQYLTFVKYFPDLYVYEFADPTEIIPFPWKGTQGWKKLEREDILKIDLKPREQDYGYTHDDHSKGTHPLYFTNLEAWKMRRNASKFVK